MHSMKITVQYDYPVYFTSGVFSPANTDLVESISRKEPQRRHRLLTIVDRGVADAWPTLASQIQKYVQYHRERLELVAEPWILDGGEAAKNGPETATQVQARLHALGIDRHSFVVIVGGGAILDAVGFAAATVHRGVRVVRLPTTVLAQCDAGLGFKTGINAYEVKNLLGSFSPPFAVINDERFLETLSLRDTIAGMAEAVKVALISDPAFFDWLRRNASALAVGERTALTHLVRRGAELHLDGMAASVDPFGLNIAHPHFGHWAAHKIESLSGNRVRHGEAVAIGIALDTCYAVEARHVHRRVRDAVIRLLETLGFTLWDDVLELVAPDDNRLLLLDGLSEFREYVGGELTITLLAEIGQRLEIHDVRQDNMLRAWDWLRRHCAAPDAGPPIRADARSV
jgi:3-dehydroquinate synthase